MFIRSSCACTRLVQIRQFRAKAMASLPINDIFPPSFVVVLANRAGSAFLLVLRSIKSKSRFFVATLLGMTDKWQRATGRPPPDRDSALSAGLMALLFIQPE